MHYQFSVRTAQAGTLLEMYQAPATSKYSQALARLKKYKKHNPYIIEDNTGDIITRAQCEYILK